MINIESEIGTLRKVIIHSPGREIQDMTPKMAEKLLYNDIIPLSVVRGEHNNFKKILQRVSEVYEYRDLLKDIFEDEKVKSDFIDRLTEISGNSERRNELIDMEPEKLTEILVTGMRQKNTSLEKYLSDNEYDINPLPNLYFTRDAAMVIGSKVITGCMANEVRRPEAEIAAAVFESHPALANGGFLFDGHNYDEQKAGGFSIEGGDVIVLSEKCLLIGCSERTTAAAIDAVVSRVEEGTVIYAVILPRERATIHLDMIFTQIDRHEVMVYEPYIIGCSRLRFLRIETHKDEGEGITEVSDLLEALRKDGYDFKPVFCGDADPVQQQREQWLSGNNFFAVAPGKIIGYACNNYTMDALHKAGYEIKKDEDFLTGGDSIDRYKKLVIGISGVELARGGGGARCMTLPVDRMSI